MGAEMTMWIGIAIALILSVAYLVTWTWAFSNAMDEFLTTGKMPTWWMLVNR